MMYLRAAQPSRSGFRRAPGSGPGREFLADPKPSKASLSNIDVRGAVNETGLVEAMRSANAPCAPSGGDESFKMVLVEALAAGLPVPASGIPGYDAVITRGKDGALFPPGSPGAPSDALVRLPRVRRYDRRRAVAETGRAYLVARSRSAIGEKPASGA